MKNNTPLLDDLADNSQGTGFIQNDEIVKLTTTTGLTFIAKLIRSDTRKGTALMRSENGDGTYSIISVTNVMAIEQVRDSDTDAVVQPQ